MYLCEFPYMNYVVNKMKPFIAASSLKNNLTNTMKYTLSILLLLVVFAACQPQGGVEEEVIPTDLVGKKEYLKTKKAELRELTRTINKLETEINELAPPAEKSKTLVTTQPLMKKDFKKFVELQAVVQSDDLVSAKVDLEQIDKQEAELRKSLELATELYERQSRLWKQNIGSEVQYLQAKNNKERIETTLETLRFQKTKANVYAPISGVIDQEFLKVGELAAPGMPIVQILNVAKVKVVANVPESYLGSVKRGELVTIKFPAINEETKAKVTQLGRTINPSNRTFEVEVTIPNRKGILKPNLLALMLINDFAAQDVITIPIDLIQQEVSGKQYVYIQEQEGDVAIAKKIYVEIGESYEGEVVINSGLTGRETLITEGARGLSDGEYIEVDDSVMAEKS